MMMIEHSQIYVFQQRSRLHEGWVGIGLQEAGESIRPFPPFHRHHAEIKAENRTHIQ